MLAYPWAAESFTPAEPLFGFQEGLQMGWMGPVKPLVGPAQSTDVLVRTLSTQHSPHVHKNLAKVTNMFPNFRGIEGMHLPMTTGNTASQAHYVCQPSWRLRPTKVTGYIVCVSFCFGASAMIRQQALASVCPQSTCKCPGASKSTNDTPKTPAHAPLPPPVPLCIPLLSLEPPHLMPQTQIWTHKTACPALYASLTILCRRTKALKPPSRPPRPHHIPLM